MDSIITWEPILWTGRVVLLIVLLGAGWAALLSLARFFRPRHIWALLGAPLPKFRSFGGSAQILGQKVEANATLDTVRDDEVNALRERIAVLEAREVEIMESVDRLIREGGHGRK